jgi:hypothetical protein
MIDVYTVRMGLIDTGLWNAADLVNLYKTELKAAGFASNQLPSVDWPEAKVSVKANEPFTGARSITVSVPQLGDFSQTRDGNVPYEQDPAKLAQVGKAFPSIFTWNLCFPNPAPNADGAGILRDIFRRVRPEGILKLSPKVSTWESAPELQNGYPAKGPRPVCGAVPDAGTNAAAPAKGPGLGAVFGALLGLYLLSRGT